uniref:Uncharacterized protein n=1 Tax=Tanacetum cinerariifolium TaxID=118510 RepID=A0A699H4S7_TANCI|nr:hypothetical protein [Tanacetum cinerariifolium]
MGEGIGSFASASSSSLGMTITSSQFQLSKVGLNKGLGRRHIDIEPHGRDLQLEVCRERYSRSKLLLQNLHILFKVDFDQGFKGLRLSSFAGVLGFIKIGIAKVINDDDAVAQRRLEDKHLEERTNTDRLVKEQEMVHLGVKVGADITIAEVPGQEGPENACPIILLRNLDLENILCNGMRLICKRFDPNVINAEIVAGHHAGIRVFFLRIPHAPFEEDMLPFKLNRKQFHESLSSAMIN